MPMYDAFLQELVQLNFLPIGIILFLIVFLYYNDAYEHELTILFAPSLVLLIVLVVDDNIDYYFLNHLDRGVLHVTTAIVGYNTRILLMLSLIFILLRKSKSPLKKLLWLPAAVNLLITLLAYFTRLVFWYDETGEVVRGPLAYSPHLTALLYALLLSGFGVRLIFLGKSDEAVIVLLTTMLAMAGTAVETVFQLRGILIGVIAMDVTFYYLYIHIEYFKMDVLTGAFNRVSFYADIQKMNRRAGVGVVSIDLNNLKVINDTKGHAEGDKALLGVVKLIKSCLCKGCKLYRTGGDEFVILCSGIGQKKQMEMLGGLQRKMLESPYIFAVGSAIWEENEKFDDAYARADKEMYLDKKRLKESVS